MNGEELYRACLEEGNREAWAVLYACLRRRMMRYGRSLCEEEREALCQDMILIVYRNLGTGNIAKPEHFVNLCLKLAEWRPLDYLRARKRGVLAGAVPLEEDDRRACDGGGGSGSMPAGSCAVKPSGYEGYRVVRTVERALARWKDRPCREVLGVYFRYRGGDPRYPSYKDMARGLNRKLGTLGTAVSRCLRKLQQLAEIRGLLACPGGFPS